MQWLLYTKSLPSQEMLIYNTFIDNKILFVKAIIYLFLTVYRKESKICVDIQIKKVWQTRYVMLL